MADLQNKYLDLTGLSRFLDNLDNRYVDKTSDQTISGTKQFTTRPALKVERLPSAYQEVTYLHADGNQYINTGIPGHMGWTYKLIYQQDNVVSYRCWGVFNQSSYNGGLNMSLTYTFPDWMLRWETTSGQTRNVLLGPIDTNQHTLVVDNGETYFDNVYKGISAAHDSSVVSNYNVYLFTINPGGTTPTTNLVGKIFYYEVYDNNGTLQQQFIPCIRKSDNKPGFYDLASNTFKTNASGSSTDFTVGANVVNSEFLVAADLAAVAISGDYADLINKPSIPTVSNATITIKQSGILDQTFTLNGSAKTITLNDTTYSDATTSVHGLMSAADKTKLDGIATGAEVNVQSDWNITDSTSDAYIKNKPTIPTKDSDLTNDRYVRYDTASQGLTSTQKSNARTNIGAGTSNFSGSYNDLTNKPTLGTAAAKDFTTSVTSESSDLVTSGAVYTAISNLPEPMVFKGSLGTGGTITSLPTASATYEGNVYKVITAGTYAGQAAKVGDTFICGKTTGSSYEWVLIPSGDEPSGTVTSVGLSLPSNEFTVSGSPVTDSGTLTGSWKNQNANTVFAGPTSGSAATPTFRVLSSDDISDLPEVEFSTTGYQEPTATVKGMKVGDDEYNFFIPDSIAAATTSVLGSVKLGTASAGTATKTYPVGFNASQQMYVDVPWTDTTSFTITANATDGIFDLTGTSGTNAVTYALAPYSDTTATSTWVGNNSNAGKFYYGTVNPQKDTRLNYNGKLYATDLYVDSGDNSHTPTQVVSLAKTQTITGDKTFNGSLTAYGGFSIKQGGETTCTSLYAIGSGTARSIGLPDASGTLALEEDLPQVLRFI